MKHVLVTGGSRGIGAAVVRLFSEKGYRVSFTYLHAADAAKNLMRETGALGIMADSANPADILRAAKTAGDTDILVNNAAVSSFSLMQDLNDELWEKTIAVNLSAPFLYSRAVLPYMIREKWGRIVNIASMWGETGASCEVHYSAAKAGLIGMTKALAKEVGPSGITVNAVSPGVIATDMNSALSESDLAALREETPLGRIGSVHDVASAVLFLAGDDASFITGDVLRVNGGFLI